MYKYGFTTCFVFFIFQITCVCNVHYIDNTKNDLMSNTKSEHNFCLYLLES